MLVSRLAAACVLSVVSASAMAGSYSLAQVGDLTFTLIDLDPTDGIDPSYTLLALQAGSFSSVSATANDTAQGWSESESRSRNLSFYPLDATAEAGGASAQAQVRPDAVSASGVANGTGTSYNAAASSGGNGYYYYAGYGIELSARSALIVSATASAQTWAGNATCTTGGISYYYGSCGSESASASASLNLSYSYSSGTTSTHYSFADQVMASSSAVGTYGYQYDPYYGYRYVALPGVDQGQDNSRVLTAVFTNSSDVFQNASLGLAASVQGSATTMVPEPSTLAMQALGLAGIAGLVARRRRARSRQA